MADQELRRRRVGQEGTEIRKKHRAERIYKIEKKSEPMSWSTIALIVLSVILVILFLVGCSWYRKFIPQFQIEAFTGFKRVKKLF
ncbi:hypothetical protein CAEBREN_15965 [Caenorhabditis brenneri]|uniref:Uncharacterized protein n=1 Tax=Caenorhabditis brenneri TaxID=135651 RepID=G0N7N9_CAEBE|nr:hypothetical protein CAEBREN_15965 [Caenorhabditis brenneri]